MFCNRSEPLRCNPVGQQNRPVLGRIVLGRIGLGRIGLGRIVRSRIVRSRIVRSRIVRSRIGLGRIGLGRIGLGRIGLGRIGLGRIVRGLAAKGFSLVELIVVIVIIGMLASLVAFRTRSYLIVSKQNAAKLDISRIVQAVDTYYATHDHYPSNEAGLEVLTRKDALFADGILKSIPLDPWKHPYQYNSPGADSAYEVICLGADNREGGEGPNRDLSSEELDRRAE